jgi:hypothetical protein
MIWGSDGRRFPKIYIQGYDGPYLDSKVFPEVKMSTSPLSL